MTKARATAARKPREGTKRGAFIGKKGFWRFETVPRSSAGAAGQGNPPGPKGWKPRIKRLDGREPFEWKRKPLF